MYREHVFPICETRAEIPLYQTNDFIHERKLSERAPDFDIHGVIINARFFYPDDESVIVIYSLYASAS